MFRRFLRVLPVLAVMLVLTVAPAAAGAPRVSLSLGLLPVIDTLPLIVAEKNRFFEEQGIDVRFLYFASALERDVALQSGKVDAYFGDLLNTLLLINSGRRLSVVTSVMRTDPRQRMFALLAAPESRIGGREGRLRARPSPYRSRRSLNTCSTPCSQNRPSGRRR